MKIKNSKIFSTSKIFAVALTMTALVAFVLNGCSLYRKISAADILSKTKLEFNSLSLDSVSINKDLFPQQGFGGGFLPNPQVIALVQNFSKGILEKEIGKAGLTIGLVANNQSEDTLCIKKLSAMVDMDTILSVPVELNDSVLMIPGTNQIEVVAQMPIDKRLFKLMEVNSMKFKGRLEATLANDDNIVPFDFDLSRSVTQEEKQALAEKARTSVLNSIVNDWVGAILPQD
ncbi:MAG: hypothetical protein MJZ25_14340 [Fibrobacter sp.]|nr:hypothetical protein [Fibrobacter sp.]